MWTSTNIEGFSLGTPANANISVLCTKRSEEQRSNPRRSPHSLRKITAQECQSVKCVTICCLNCRSVKNKTEAINDYIVSNDFDIVALTETWLGILGTYDHLYNRALNMF